MSLAPGVKRTDALIELGDDLVHIDVGTLSRSRRLGNSLCQSRRIHSRNPHLGSCSVCGDRHDFVEDVGLAEGCHE